MSLSWTATPEIEQEYRQLYAAGWKHAELGARFRPDLDKSSQRKDWSNNFSKRVRTLLEVDLGTGVVLDAPHTGSGTEHETSPSTVTSTPWPAGPLPDDPAAFEAIPDPYGSIEVEEITPAPAPPVTGRGVWPRPQIADFPSQAYTRFGNRRYLRFGLISDQHFASHYARQDVLTQAYNKFAEQGINCVINCGNWIDGQKRFNQHEVHCLGLDKQLNYAADRWPDYPDIHTYFVAGDDHEGWYQQDMGIEVGERFEDVFRSRGRDNMHYLGYVWHDLRLPGTEERFIRVMHPGGGTAKSISLMPQNIVSALAPGNRPELLLIGHYHKAEYLPYYFGVSIIQAGCMQDQSVFCAKKNIIPHIGYWIVELELNENGTIRSCAPQWFGGFERHRANGRFHITGATPTPLTPSARD